MARGRNEHLLMRRHKKVFDTSNVPTCPSIRCLARRGGVKRISKPVYEIVRAHLRDFLTGILGDALSYADYAHRKTITAHDIIYALKNKGIMYYGAEIYNPFPVSSGSKKQQRKGQNGVKRSRVSAPDAVGVAPSTPSESPPPTPAASEPVVMDHDASAAPVASSPAPVLVYDLVSEHSTDTESESEVMP